jgi:anti-sigma regulatory factor (Ser/Thr protein kinase)
MHRPSGGGELLLEVRKVQDGLRFVIQDNGVGRKRAAEMKSKSATKDRSFGMAITKERMDMARQNSNYDLSVAVEDLFDAKQHPAGTRVTITMKRKTDD